MAVVFRVDAFIARIDHQLKEAILRERNADDSGVLEQLVSEGLYTENLSRNHGSHSRGSVDSRVLSGVQPDRQSRKNPAD